MTFLALPWFVLVTTGSAAKMSIALAVEILPIALLGIPSGALVARLGARTIPLLGLPLPAGAVVAVLFTSAIFGPLVNAPLIGVLTMRTPEALRPKVMTGVLTMALLAGPIGLVIVGPLLASWGPRPVLLFVALGQFLATLPFAFFALRGRKEAPVTLEAA
jgi:hypothetical protein